MREPAERRHEPELLDRPLECESEALLAAIIATSDDAIVSKTLDGTILTWNAGAERLFGYSAEEAVGRSIIMIIPPEHMEEERMLASRLRAGERVEHHETVRVARDGRRVDISLSISPIRDRQGRIVGAAKVARDISARRLAQGALIAVKDELSNQLADVRRLHEMNVRLSTMLELQPILDEVLGTAVAIQNTDMGILSLVDPDDDSLRIGASVGFDPEMLRQIEQLPARAGARGKCLTERRRIVVEDIENEPELSPFLELSRRAGVRAAHSTPMFARQGRMVGILATHFRQPRKPSEREAHLIDLCARQAVEFIENARLYRQLRDADRSKNEFLATLAHELRNSLAPIRNATHILQVKSAATPEMHWALNIADRQMKHMSRLVDDLLDISRITGGKLELRKERIDLAEILHAAVETSRPLIEACDQQLILDAPAQPVFLSADLTRIAQAISNMLNNAAKYGKRGGRIWLDARLEGDVVTIAVRDDGMGIPADMLPRIFEMFTQVNRSLDRSQGGLGVGLSLVKRLVELHGGTVTATSAGLDAGSEFVVRLPAARMQAPVRQAGAAFGPGAPLASSLRILVVDDNQDAATTLALLLRMMGNEVRTAHDGLAGVALATEFRPQVALLDIGLPGIDGYEAAERIRKQPWAESATIIAVTGWGNAEDVDRAKAAGFDRHLLKPVDPAELMRILMTLDKTA